MQKRYSNSGVILHWLSGVLILFVLVTGTFVLSSIPNTVDKINSFQIHMILGLVITILTAIRVINIIKSEKVEPLKVSKLREKVIKANHIAIYVVLLAIGISGILLSKSSSLGEIVFFGADLEIYSSFKDYSIGMVHGILTKVLIFLIAMHLVGVISYMTKTKENILKKIWFR